MSNKVIADGHNPSSQAMREFAVAHTLNNRKARGAYYAFNEHVLLCGDHIPMEDCSHADVHWLHARQLVIAPVRRHEKLFARHAAEILLDRANYA